MDLPCPADGRNPGDWAARNGCYWPEADIRRRAIRQPAELIVSDSTLLPCFSRLSWVELFDHLLNAGTCAIRVQAN